MKLDEIIKDLHALEGEIQKLENKYSILSEYFYKLFQSGKLEHNKDFTKWAGLYEIKLRRERDFKKFLPQALETAPFDAAVSKDFFETSTEEV